MNRREWLKAGLGSVAFAGMAGAREAHFPARAKRVIFLYMQGAPSQYETFDDNPEYAKAAARDHALIAPAFTFKPSGQSGLPISELFPLVAQHADDLCLLNAMQTDSPAHPQATIELHTGSFNFVRPSMGAWVVYGLGTENSNLPGFLTINPSGQGGAANYGSAFLPATYQGTPYFTRTGKLPNIANPSLGAAEQRKQLDLIQGMNRDYLDRGGHHPEVEGVIESYEMAFRMQTAVPGLLDLKGESAETRKLYGLDDRITQGFGTQCLLARRMAEAGVRFIELSHGNWDHHNNLRARIKQAATEIDRPIAGLLADLKGRGILQDTLVVWGGEFGRTTNGQNGDGRNHNSRGFTMWMAGGGVKGGMRHGSCDPVSGSAVEGKVHLHDLHATMLHLLGLDHTRLTYRYGGRDFRLTDVHGKTIREVLA